MGVRVFLSYRRDDSSHVAGRLRDRLCDAFGEEHVFYDVDSINPGDDFRKVIIDTLALVDLVLVVIGPNWRPERLQREGDYVRIEILEALRQEKRVVPVLLDEVPMPTSELLPAELETLAFLNAMRLRRDPDFRVDSGRILEHLRRLDAMHSGRESSDPVARTSSAVHGLRRQLRSNTVDGSALFDVLTQWLRVHPADAWAMVTRGTVWELHRKDLDGALADYNEAIRLDPTNSGAFTGRGNVRSVRNDLDGALVDYSAAIRRDPTSSVAFIGRGNVRYVRTDLDGAFADYTEAIRIEPTSSVAFLSRGNVRYDRKDLDGALADYTEAIRLAPTNSGAFTNRALVWRQRGETQLAVADEEEARRLAG